eukprot:10290571-Ditylum_brightwellii.AAC.1
MTIELGVDDNIDTNKSKHQNEEKKVTDENAETAKKESLTGMTMQAKENNNGHKQQEEGDPSDNTSLMGMTIGEKEINGGPN